MRFIDSNGFDIPNISEYHIFDILISYDSETFFITAKNHNYHSIVKIVQDPCFYSIFNKNGYEIGYFNSCDRILEL